MSSIAALLREGAAALPGEDARMEAEWLLAHLLDRDRAWLFAHTDETADEALRTRFHALVQRRIEGHPIAHLIGHRGFWSLDLTVDASTLIPRPETELLVELALKVLPKHGALRVLDLGTGSGAIALALAKERAEAEVLAVDASDAALQVARGNALRNGIVNVGFRHSDWFAAIGRHERFECIVSNPPYIADADPHLQQGDLRFEPRTALASGVDGLDDIRRIIAEAPAHLRDAAWLIIEHGFDQGAAVRGLFEQRGFASVRTAQDWEARDRVSLGQWPG